MIFWRSLSTRSKTLIFIAIALISSSVGSFYGIYVTLPRVLDRDLDEKIGALDPVVILTLYFPYLLTAVFMIIAILLGLKEDRENREK